MLIGSCEYADGDVVKRIDVKVDGENVVLEGGIYNGLRVAVILPPDVAPWALAHLEKAVEVTR